MVDEKRAVGTWTMQISSWVTSPHLTNRILMKIISGRVCLYGELAIKLSHTRIRAGMQAIAWPVLLLRNTVLQSAGVV